MAQATSELPAFLHFLPSAGIKHEYQYTQEWHGDIGFVTSFTEKQPSINPDGQLRAERWGTGEAPPT